MGCDFKLFVLTGLALGAAAPVALAQPPSAAPSSFGPGPAARPPVSPFLNLVRPNVNPAVNYYALVRPQIQTRSELQSLQNQLLIPPFAAAGGADQPSVTGTAAGFQNYRSYFQNQFSLGGTGAAPGSAPRAGVGGSAAGGAFGTARPPRR